MHCASSFVRPLLGPPFQAPFWLIYHSHVSRDVQQRCGSKFVCLYRSEKRHLDWQVTTHPLAHLLTHLHHLPPTNFKAHHRMPMYTGSSEQSRLLKREISAFLGIDVTYLGDYLVAMSEGRLSLSVIDEYIAEPGQRLMIPHLQFIPGFGLWTTDQLYDELEQLGKPFFLIRAFKQKLFPEREAITTRPPNPAFLVGAFWSLFFQNPPHNQPAGFFPLLPNTVQDAIRRFWSDYLKVLHREVNPGAKYNPSDPLRKLNVPRRQRRKSKCHFYAFPEYLSDLLTFRWKKSIVLFQVCQRQRTVSDLVSKGAVSREMGNGTEAR